MIEWVLIYLNGKKKGFGFGHSLEKMGANTHLCYATYCTIRALFIGCAMNRKRVKVELSAAPRLQILAGNNGLFSAKWFDC